MFLATICFAKSYCHIFFDGTTNDKTQGTNVWNMFNHMPGVPVTYSPKGLNKDKVDAMFKSMDNHRSVYVPGVGTSLSLTAIEKNVQSVSGSGIEKRAILGYQYILDACEKDFGTEYVIKIIGFSRGATTARMFATYISLYGLSAANTAIGAGGMSDFEKTFLNPAVASKVGRMPVIEFMGLFDSVASIGTFRRLDPDNLPTLPPPYGIELNLAKMSLKIPSMVMNVAHAVALNEYRNLFEYTPIATGNPKWIEKFFVGSHGDIGGFLNSHRQKIAQSWMVVKGMSHVLFQLVLKISTLKIMVGADMIDCYKGITSMAGVKPRPVDFKRAHITVTMTAMTAKLQRVDQLLDHDTAFSAIARIQKKPIKRDYINLLYLKVAIILG